MCYLHLFCFVKRYLCLITDIASFVIHVIVKRLSKKPRQVFNQKITESYFGHLQKLSCQKRLYFKLGWALWRTTRSLYGYNILTVFQLAVTIGGWVRLSWWAKACQTFFMGRFNMGVLQWETDVLEKAVFDCSLFRVELASSERWKQRNRIWVCLCCFVQGQGKSRGRASTCF